MFHKYAQDNVAVKKFMSCFSMLVPTKSTVKLANGDMGHAKLIEVILYHFINCPIIYPVGPFYYCSGHPSNTISSGSLKFYIGFQKFASEPLEHCDFVHPQGCSWK